MGVDAAEAGNVRVVERRPVVFCDFDGTITMDEVIVEVWRAFAPPGWEDDVEAMLAGRKSLLQGVPEVFARISASRAPEIAAFAKRIVRFRPGFEDLLRYCRAASIEFTVTTGALDFFVEPVLEPYRGLISRIVSIPADLSGEVIRARTDMACETCALCKAKAMAGFQDTFRIVVGDSITDEHGALAADAVFARDRLAAIMRERGLPYHSFDTLLDVRDMLRDSYTFPATTPPLGEGPP